MFDSDTGGTSWWSPGTRLVYLFMALLTCGLAYLQQPSLGFMTVVLITGSGLVLLALCFYLGFSFGFWLSSKGISQFKGKVKGKFKRQSPQCFLGFWKRSLNLMQISFGKKAPPAAIKALKKRNNLAMRVSGMGKQVGKVVPPRVLPTGAQKTLLGGTGAGWVLQIRHFDFPFQRTKEETAETITSDNRKGVDGVISRFIICSIVYFFAIAIMIFFALDCRCK